MARAPFIFARISDRSHNKSYLHSKKYEKIAELFGEIHSFLESFVAKQKEIRRLIKVVSDRIEQDIRTYRKNNNDSNIFVQLFFGIKFGLAFLMKRKRGQTNLGEAPMERPGKT